MFVSSYMYIYIRVFVYLCLYICIFNYVHINTVIYIHTYIFSYVYTYKDIHIQIHIYIYIYIHVHLYEPICMYIYIYIYLHTHMYDIYIYMVPPGAWQPPNDFPPSNHPNTQWGGLAIYDHPSRSHMLYLHAGLVPPKHYITDTSMQCSLLPTCPYNLFPTCYCL